MSLTPVQQSLQRHARLRGRQEEGPSDGNCGALVQIGLDNMRHLNADCGWEAGDRLLKRICEVLPRISPSSAVLHRGHGDTIAVFIPEMTGPEATELARVYGELIRATRLEDEGGDARTTASIGVVPLAEGEAGADWASADPLVCADLALARAKAEGRDRVSTFDRRDLERHRMSRGWAESIHRAILGGEFTVMAQPVIDLQSGETAQWELLVRLRPEAGELMPPSRFFPTAERFGLLHHVDHWVMNRAIDLVATHRDAGRDPRLELNVAPSTLTTTRYVEVLGEMLERRGVPGESLIIEVAELPEDESSVLLERVDTLKELGCGFAIDNLGAVGSSLLLLRRLPLDLVKLDGELSRELESDPRSQHVVRSLASLAHGLGSRVVATKLPDESAARCASRLGADMGQGFALGRAVPASKMI